MSGYIAGPAASKTTGTFVLANNTTEQIILDVLNADRVVQDVNMSRRFEYHSPCANCGRVRTCATSAARMRAKSRAVC